MVAAARPSRILLLGDGGVANIEHKNEPTYLRINHAVLSDVREVVGG